MKAKKKLGLVQILDLIKSGLSPAKISEKYKIPKQTLDYHVGKLKKQGCIVKKGYGVWEYIKPYKKSQNLTIRQVDRSNQNIRTSKKKEIRGHAFIWKIEFVEPYNWNRATRRYKKKKLIFQSMKHNKVLRTVFEGRKIWLTDRGMIIYEPIDFLGKSSFEVKGKAVYEMDLLIKNFLKELNLKFKKYRFTTSREHYGIIKNELARQYNEKKKKMRIASEDGSVWMWIDDSKSLGELENNEPNVNRQVQNFWNNHKKHQFGVNADFVLNGFEKQNQIMQGIQENQLIFDKNMSSHLKVLKKLGVGVDELTKTVGILSKKIQELK